MANSFATKENLQISEFRLKLSSERKFENLWSQKIEIFLDEIRIFYNDETRDCYKDEILSIYEASDANPKNKLIKNICGDSTTMAPVRTNSNFVTIEFTTGNYKKNWKPSHSKEWNGFYIYYQTYSL